MENTDKRILVLGSDLSTKLVTSYPWDKLPEGLNVADYDVVIVNFIDLYEPEYSNLVELDKLPARSDFYHLLFSNNSEIIFLGYPVTINQKKMSSNNYSYYYATFYWEKWLPLMPKFILNKGESIKIIQPNFDYYFKNIKCYCYYLENNNILNITQDLRLPENMIAIQNLIDYEFNDFDFKINVMAETRFQKAIAFELKFIAVGRNSYEKLYIIKESGKVIWLPPTTEIPQDEGIRLILKERYGLELTQVQPSWLSAYQLPHQIPLEEKITQYQEKIKRLESQVQASQEQLQHETRFLQLLYEQGKALEIVVRDTLSLLGAEVEKAEKGKEDGRFTDTQGRKGMLEIKGKTGTLALKDINQLDRRVRDAKILEGKDYKGIVIINAHRDKPPNQRPDPFPANCIETAEQTAKQCLMTTSQLFRALCDHQEGKLNIEEFWDAIFNTNGVCPLPDIELQDIETCNNSVGMVGDAHPTMMNFENKT
ncbi:hypothetical protein PCC7424_1382 [Gloeothece citriformis PCC 7424]|uniref:Uncharacterized protein n=1 Tax=Gloeothece citriformis (strain PCC 7424) TaxID=65393 RepID=B7K7Q8_GLOC7|nr:hypothetical protein [Gloeothece citriformis]ACK69826.1 hypothetical protein PCC7424_1382 [Gloeothece citriformis PCC 7424]